MEVKTREEMLDAIELRGCATAEIGVLEGDFSAQILTRGPLVHYMIDPWTSQDPLEYMDRNNRDQADFDAMSKAVQKRFAGNGAANILRMTSAEASRAIECNNFDFVYLDGNHSFEHVFFDLCAWYPKIKSGGWLCGHDLSGNFWGVRQAVITFCNVTGLSLDIVTEKEAYQSYGIRIK